MPRVYPYGVVFNTITQSIVNHSIGVNMETKFKVYKDGCIWINASIFISVDDIDFDHSYTSQIDNSKETETISHYYSDDQKNQIISHIRSEVFNFFLANKDDLLKEAKVKVGSGNRITSFEN
jgi:hypothetical protein